MYVEIKCQLDVTEVFIADLIACSTCFGHYSMAKLWQCTPTLTSIQDLFQPNSWLTPVAVVTVYSAPDDGHKGRPKHVEHTCSC